MAEKAFNAVQSSNCEKFLEKHASKLSSFINTRQDGSGQTPLMMSVLMGQTDCVKSLLSYPEVDVTIPEKDGYTPMHGAGFQGRSEILKLLIADSRQIDANDRHADGYNAIHRACWGREAKHTETVKTFIEVGGVEFAQANAQGMTCLEMTQNEKTKKYLKKLMKNEKKKLEL
jgi:ankyrin repeat protein